MAAPQYRPGKYLLLLLLLIVGLTAWAFAPIDGYSVTPRLGLDLRGGTQVILDPQPITEGAEITEEQLQQSVEIIRQRVNGVGVAEADISIQGTGSDAVIVVSVPGVTQDRIVELVGRTALLDFRPVENILDPAPVGANETESADNANNKNNKKNNKNQNESASQSDAGDTGPTVSEPTDEAAEDELLQGGDIVQAKVNDAKFQQEVLALDCNDTRNQLGGTPDDPELWLGTCQRVIPDKETQAPAAKYVLKPAFIRGTEITSAAAQLPQQGAGGWVVTLSFDSEGASKLAEISGQLVNLPPPTNQFAIVLDGVVVSAPSFEEQILGGEAQISGNFTAQEAEDLANVLKFGALPVKLQVQQVESISATVGDSYLRAGLLAGIIGLILVAGWLIFYYRILGVVAALSLVLAGWMTYCLFVILGNTIGFTLTLAGVAGAIVAIGITADSFIVYFERIRDEIRDGKSLRRSVDEGWVRARRTLLAADFVSILAAVVLYFLSVGNVRGFAFALGLTTVMDVLVAFWFTRPSVTVLARSAWMQKGSSFTGLSPKRLGVESLGGTRRERTSRRSKSKAAASTSSSDSGSEG
ncbi:MAG: protein translocase subunit SecD [Actinomycetia bacterium]|nr:protein translocase subunit SecD [Actinomycetes bacterium]